MIGILRVWLFMHALHSYGLMILIKIFTIIMIIITGNSHKVLILAKLKAANDRFFAGCLTTNHWGSILYIVHDRGRATQRCVLCAPQLCVISNQALRTFPAVAS
jgi:hypothetical protein